MASEMVCGGTEGSQERCWRFASQLPRCCQLCPAPNMEHACCYSSHQPTAQPLLALDASQPGSTGETCMTKLLLGLSSLLLITIMRVDPLSAQQTPRMAFVMETDRFAAFKEVTVLGYRQIYASGPITEGDADRFVAFVRTHKLDAARVIFNSPGGSLFEGVKLGRAIRALHFDTAVGQEGPTPLIGSSAICASACAYAFAGGALRFMSIGGGRLGLHQFRTEKGPGISEGDAQTVSGLLIAYLAEMGIDAKAFAIASVTDSSGIVWLHPKEAEALGFSNDGVRPTTAEVKITNMRPYLRLNQEMPGVTLRVLLLCDQRKLSLMAGIVTDPQQTRDSADKEWLKRSYVEFDGAEALVVPGITGVRPDDSTVWLPRELSADTALVLLRVNDLGVWLDGFGMVREGGRMDLRQVRPVLKNYVDECYSVDR